ncbi:MAG TPA: hypothetical protein VEI02_10970 [Planctomycetota bacterium]|nr:hypothetical protein [Planctomycetota bacterium]
MRVRVGGWIAFAATWALLGCGRASCGDASFRLVAPVDQCLRQGAAKRADVVVVRRACDRPIQVEFLDLPEGVSVRGANVASIPPGYVKTEFVLVAAPDARPVDGHRARVVARADDGSAMKEFFNVRVEPKE